MLSAEKPFTVCAVHCDYRSTDEEVYQALKRATDQLPRSWEKLSKARRIAIKFNQDWTPSRIVMYEGHRQQLIDDSVARAVLRLLREHTRAEIYIVDIGTERITYNVTDGSDVSLGHIFREFDVSYYECEKLDVDWVPVPGGGQMFTRCPLPRIVMEADELVSVQKMKNHQFTGVTLCLKNLFALSPLGPGGRPRQYYHHLVRMPYLLSDLGRMINPALNVIDGLVGQAGQEWGRGEYPRVCNTLIAGDHVIATDAYGAYLMGHDPQADWPVMPFHRDRNPLLVASEAGFGTVDLNQIDFRSEVTAPVGEFFSNPYDTPELVRSWRQSMSEQALFYRDHQAHFVNRYSGQYILLQMGEVCWSGAEWNGKESRRVLSGSHPEQAMWLKYVDPREEEGEHFEVYEKTLQTLKRMELA
jgi:uncharacterized protein (DUF362 family)